MQKVAEAIYKSLRDDSEATVGIRALLGNTTAAPYNVYHAFPPESLDFSPSAGSQGFITYQFVSGVPDNEQHSEAGRIMQEVYNVTAYHRDLETIKSIHWRIKYRLQGKRAVANPTSQAHISNIKLDAGSEPKWDDFFKVWRHTKFYRAWVRDDNLP